MKEIERNILELLEACKGGYIHLSTLCNEVNETKSNVKRAVQSLRKQGYTIISNSNGYKLTEDREEIQQFLDSMKRQAVTRFASVKQIAKDFKTDSEQISIYEYISSVCNGEKQLE